MRSERQEGSLALLERLVAFPTVSRDPNRDLIEFVRAYLADRGIACELFTAEGGRKANLFATLGPSDRPGIMLSGHTDVVPVDGQAWSSDPFRLDVRGGRAFGRGTADMKGFVACALSLIDRTPVERLSTPIHLALSHDEEIGCVGVRTMIDALRHRTVKPRVAIVGEPTLLRVAIGHKGKIAARATCCGSEAHSALAPKALNAIHLACDFVGAVRARQEETALHGTRDDEYEIPYTTFHVGRIGGGTALNVVPSTCAVDFEIRSIVSEDAGAVLRRLAEDATSIAASRRSAFPTADIRIEVQNDYPGLTNAPDADVVGFMRDIAADPGTLKVPFGTEGGLFCNLLGIPTVVCGPGSMDQGHKRDEFIALDQLEACDRMLDRLLERCL